MIKELLSANSWFIYNKKIAKAYGVDEAIILGCLCNKANYFQEDEFFCTQEYLLEDTCLSEYRLRNGLQSLKDKKAINIVKKGLPAKNYYSINEAEIEAVLHQTSGCNFDTTGDNNFDTTRPSKIDTTYNNNKVEINNKETNNKENNIVDTTTMKVIAHLNELTESHYIFNSKENTKLIKALINKGYTEKEILKVIDKKFIEWKGTDFEKYIRPSTLFGSKFEQYLNQPITKDMETKLWLMTPEGDNNGIQ